jgi:protein-L-isoaspartate(D-aspartate) O-methyltransferase
MTVTEERHDTSLAQRKAMIDSQLRTSGVNEPWILEAMGALAREDFVPEAMRSAAYIDRAIPLGGGRMLAAPLVQGRMLAEARPTGADKALLVGDGAGYLAALLRPLVGSLDAVDPSDAAQPIAGGPIAGGPIAGGYSLVVIDGAIETLPQPLCDSLADDGRIVTGQVLRGVTRLAVGRKAAGKVALLPLAEIGIPPLPEFAAPKRWSF